MKSFKTAPFTHKDIITTYLKQYGLLIVILELINVPIFHNTFCNIIYSSLLIIFIAIFPAYYHTYNNRVIYQIDISEENQYIIFYYFILFRSKKKIPFHKFHSECIIFQSTNESKYNLKINFRRKSLPFAYIQLKRDYVPASKNWTKEQIIEISQKLYEIKQKYPTYKKDIWYSRWQYGWERVDKFKKQDNVD